MPTLLHGCGSGGAGIEFFVGDNTALCPKSMVGQRPGPLAPAWGNDEERWLFLSCETSRSHPASQVTYYMQHIVMAGVMADAAMVDGAIERDVYCRRDPAELLRGG